MTRIAIFSDIHGNTIALKAVLDDIQSLGGVDGYWLVGDYSVHGYDPIGVLDIIKELPNRRMISGNSERMLFESASDDQLLKIYQLRYAQQGAAKIAQMIHSVGGIVWAKGMLENSTYLPWLKQLPLEKQFSLSDGTRVLLVHSSPGNDDGSGFHHNLSENETRALIAGYSVDLIFCGHTHYPFHTCIDGIEIVNCSSVSNPITDDLKAVYVILEYDQSGHKVTFYSVDYDHEAVVEEMKKLRYPTAKLITGFMRGQLKPDWLTGKSAKE